MESLSNFKSDAPKASTPPFANYQPPVPERAGGGDRAGGAGAEGAEGGASLTGEKLKQLFADGAVSSFL